MSKSKYWYCQLAGDELRVSDDENTGGQKVRAITWRAAGRKLLRKGTIAEIIAKREGEWDNPSQPQHDDSPAKDRENRWTKARLRQIRVVRG